MISDRIFDDIPPQMKNLNIVIPILMYFLTINIEKCFVFVTKCERDERRITTTLTNQKRRCSRR